MSFFGALFAGITLFAKGVTAGQHIVNDNRSKSEARRLGSQRYYDHKGIMHDAKTGRAICYYTNPKNGHKLIQDAYTLNTIRDITAEEILEKRNVARDKAREEGKWYFPNGNLFSLPRYKGCNLIEGHRYTWQDRGTLYKRSYGEVIKDKRYYKLDNFQYIRRSSVSCCVHVFENINKPGDFYVKEYIDDICVLSSVKTGLIVEVEDDMKEKLEKRGIDWNEFVNVINEYKIRTEKEEGSMPMSTNKGYSYDEN